MRVTERAQRAVLSAKDEAGRLRHDRVGTEHLLLGLLRDQQGLAVVTLEGWGSRWRPSAVGSRRPSAPVRGRRSWGSTCR